jgi:hypothetical protein
MFLRNHFGTAAGQDVSLRFREPKAVLQELLYGLVVRARVLRSNPKVFNLATLHIALR